MVTKTLAEARDNAAQVLMAGIRRNVYLQTCDVRNNGFADHVLAEINFFCELNKKGRYLIDWEELNQGVAPAIWCRVFASCRDQPSFLYYFLRELPQLLGSFRR